MSFSTLNSFNGHIGKNAIGYGKPPAPTTSGYTLISSTSTSATISFTGVSSAYRSITYTTNIGSGSGTPSSYTITGLSAGANIITIYAVGNYGQSVASASITITLGGGVGGTSSIATITGMPFFYTLNPYAITTIAGTGTAGSATTNSAVGSAISTTLNTPSSVTADNLGNYYIADFTASQVTKVDNNGAITVIINSITSVFYVAIDPANYNVLYLINGASTIMYKYVINTATLTTYFTPSGYTIGGSGLAIDNLGNIYFATNTSSIYKITTSNATQVLVSTGPAAYGTFTAGSVGVIVDNSNNLYVNDWTKRTILKLTVATNTWSLFFNYNILAANFGGFPGGGFDTNGNLYLMFNVSNASNTYSWNIIRITSQTTWAFVAGNYASALYGLSTTTYTAGTYTQENVLPGNATFGGFLNSMSVDSSNNLLIPDRFNRRVRKIYNDTPGKIYTIAGNFNSNATSGDGGLARLASLSTVRWIFVDKYFNIYVSSDVAARLRRIDGTSGIITTIAGTGTNGNTTTVNATASTSAIGTGIGGCVVDTSMNVYFADFTNKVVRKIDQFGIMNTIGGPYTPNIYAMAIDQNNNVYWVSSAGSSGTVNFYQYSSSAVTTTYTLASGYNFQSNGMYGIAVDTAQNVYLSDTASTTAATTRILKYNMGTNTTSVLTSSLGSYCIWQMVYNPSNNSLYCGTNSTGTGGGICYISCSTGAITPICTSSNSVYSNVYGTYNEVLSTNYATNYMTGMALDSLGNIYTAGGVAGTGTNASRIDIITVGAGKYNINESLPIPATVQFDASTLTSGDNILMRNTSDVTLNYVQSWNDITNTYTATQATTANQPSYLYNGMNSMDVIRFTGATGQILTTGAMPANTTNQITMFFVFNMSSFSKTFNQFFSSDNAYTSGVFHLLVTSSGVIRITLNSTNTNNDTLTITAGTNYILMVNLSTASGSWQSYARLNGVASSFYTHGGTQALVCSANWNIGNWAGDTTRSMTGSMAEMLVYYRDLSTDEIQNVEQYLSRKWKIPVTKPYFFNYGNAIANITNMGNTNAVSNLSTGAAVMGSNCMSYDGKYGISLVTVPNGTLYTTSNYGQTWTSRTKPSSSSVYALGMCGSGQYCIFPTYGSGIYYSWDYGVSWAQSNMTTGNFVESASSLSGKYWICSTANTRVGMYYSSNYGQTWTVSNITVGRWDAVAMSESGQHCIAITGGNGSPDGSGFLYSSNYGATWTASSTTPPSNPGLNGTTVPLFTQACSSSSGRYFYASSFTNGNWYSSNYGQTWTQSTMTGGTNLDWNGCQCSYDGQYVVITTNNPFSGANKGIWISSNYGVTFTQTAFLTTIYASGINMSKDLRYYFYNSLAGGIFYGTNPIRAAAPAPPTALTFISSTSTSVTFSFTASAGEVFSNTTPIQNSVTYTAYVNGTATTNGYGTPSLFTITGLTLGTSYQISLTATGISGTSQQSGSVVMNTTMPLIWYKMNPGDITSTALTNYGSAGNGTLVGSPAITNFTTGSSYGYNSGYGLIMGASNYINLPAINFNVSGRFTISMWINITSGTTTAFPYFAFNNVSGYTAAFVMTYDPNGNPYNPFLYLPNCPLGAGNYLTQIGASLADGNFHHLVVVFGGTSSGSLNVYIDNFQVKAYQSQTAYSNLTCPFTLSCTSAYSTIGYANWSTGQSITGYVGDFRLYNTGFTATDVNNLYTTMSGNAPKNLLFISATSTTITITFTAPSGTVSSYVPYVNGAQGIGSGTATAYTITGLTANTTYTIYIVAAFSSGTSAPSATITCQTVVNTSDFGLQTWYSSNLTTGAFNYLSMSDDGKYGVAGGTSAVAYYTNNYGLTWTASNYTAFQVYGTCLCGTGQYGLLGGYNSNGIWYSLNYGQTWIQSNITTSNWITPAMSYNGQYAVFSSGNTQIGMYYSSNYGKTWTVSNINVGAFQGIAMSYTGQYAIAGATAGASYTGVWYSSNYGQTWTQSNLTSNAPGFLNCSMSPTGQYAIISTYNNGMYYSSNYGQTWTGTSTAGYTTGAQIRGAGMTSNGLAIIGSSSVLPTSTYQGASYSTNYGQSWAKTALTTAYYFQAAALSQNGQIAIAASASSAGIYYTVSSVPGAPTYLQFITATSTSITIYFNAPPGPITSYAVYVNGALGSGSGSASSYTITGLSAGITYAIALTATNVRGTSIQSLPLIVSTIGTPASNGPNAPTSVTFSSATSTSLTFSFTAPTGTITTYVPFINGAIVRGSGSTSSYTITGLSATTSYKVTIAAVTSTGVSGQSNSVTMSTIT
jgi:hypothetical protein